MTTREYEKMNLAEMKRRRWRLTKEVRTIAGVIPEGTEVFIDFKRGGLHVTSAKCSHCGVQLHIFKLSCYSVEEIME